MSPVTKFVNHQVARELRRQKQQAQVDTDCPGRTPRAPAGALSPNLYFFKRRSGQYGQGPQTWLELAFGRVRQPATQCFNAQFVAPGIAAERQYASRVPIANRSGIGNKPIAHPHHLIDRGQVNHIRKCKRFRVVLCSEGVSGTFDPGTVFFDEGPHILGPCAAWHDHFDSATRENLYRESFCPGTFTHRKARRLAGLLGFR